MELIQKLQEKTQTLTLASSFTGDITITGKYDLNKDGDTSDTGETKTVTIKVVELKLKKSRNSQNCGTTLIRKGTG